MKSGFSGCGQYVGDFREVVRWYVGNYMVYLSEASSSLGCLEVASKIESDIVGSWL